MRSSAILLLIAMKFFAPHGLHRPAFALILLLIGLGRSSGLADNEPTYWELASARVPSVFGRIGTLQPLLNSSTGPDDLRLLRIGLLETREVGLF